MFRGFSVVNIFCRCVAIMVLIGMLGFSLRAHAESATLVGRYLAVPLQALPEQANLLDQTFQVRFSRDVCSVGDAIRYLLRFSGYRLVNTVLLSKTVQVLLLQPLPQVHRKLGPLSLQDGLLTLVGHPFDLVVDPVHRLVGFRLKPAFQSLYGEE